VSVVFKETGELDPLALAELVYRLTRELADAEARHDEDESDGDSSATICNMKTCLRMLGVRFYGGDE
jgi:hypothetical protein